MEQAKLMRILKMRSSGLGQTSRLNESQDRFMEGNTQIGDSFNDLGHL